MTKSRQVDLDSIADGGELFSVKTALRAVLVYNQTAGLSYN